MADDDPKTFPYGRDNNEGAGYVTPPTITFVDRSDSPPQIPEMVERGAQAMWAHSKENWWREGFDVPEEAEDPEVLANHRKYARIAIAEMREPTEAMLAAAEPIILAGGKGTKSLAAAIWQAMIGAALRE